MISEDEYIIFMKEIKLLISEFERCDDIQVKKQIHSDLMLVLDVVKPF